MEEKLLKVSLKKRILIQVGDFKVPVVKSDKSYPHFDTALLSTKKQAAKMKQILESPDLVVHHQFLPVVLRKKAFLRMYFDNNEKRLKMGKKIRPIVEVAHSDSLIFSLYAAMLNTHYEQRVSDLKIKAVATAYRRGRGSNIESSKEVIDHIFYPITAGLLKVILSISLIISTIE